MNFLRSLFPAIDSFFRSMAGSSSASSMISNRTVKLIEGPSLDSTSW